MIGSSPAHSPRFAWRRLPTAAVPEMVGSFVFVGRADVTMLVGFDVARAEPSTFWATTCDLIRNPASASRRTYVLSAALEIRRQSDASGAPLRHSGTSGTSR